jgi:hypothetical protein
MKSDINIVVILEEDAEEHKRKSIHKLASMVWQFFDDGIMENALERMAEEPLPGEPKGNCHNIAIAFMTDLIIARQAQGWSWVQGGNPNRMNEEGKAWEHSWLEYNNFVVDATIKQTTIAIEEVGSYYKRRDIKKIRKRRNAAQTRKWIFKHGNKERSQTRIWIKENDNGY